MTDQEFPATHHDKSAKKRWRNIILGIVLAASAIAMYVSIFVRLSVDPLQ